MEALQSCHIFVPLISAHSLGALAALAPTKAAADPPFAELQAAVQLLPGAGPEPAEPAAPAPSPSSPSSPSPSGAGRLRTIWPALVGEQPFTLEQAQAACARLNAAPLHGGAGAGSVRQVVVGVLAGVAGQSPPPPTPLALAGLPSGQPDELKDAALASAAQALTDAVRAQREEAARTMAAAAAAAADGTMSRTRSKSGQVLESPLIVNHDADPTALEDGAAAAAASMMAGALAALRSSQAEARKQVDMSHPAVRAARAGHQWLCAMAALAYLEPESDAVRAVRRATVLAQCTGLAQRGFPRLKAALGRLYRGSQGGGGQGGGGSSSVHELLEGLGPGEQALMVDTVDFLLRGERASLQEQYVAAGGDGAGAGAGGPGADGAPAAVSRLCACIGSPCLRHCVHGASIGGGGALVPALCARAGAAGAAGQPRDRARHRAAAGGARSRLPQVPARDRARLPRAARPDVPSPEHKYGYRDPGLTEICLRF
jgi:hypothetical protein